MATEAQSNTTTIELDQKSLGNVIDFEQAKALRQEQYAARQKAQEFSALRETAAMLGEDLILRNKAQAVEHGIRLGMSLRREIAEGRFDGGTFYTVLFLSAIKDFIDLLTLGLLGVLINVFVSIALFIVFFMKRPILKRIIIKRFIGPMIIEFIPGLSVFPTYTVATIMLKMKMDRQNHALSEQAKLVDKQIEEIKLAA